MKTLHIQEYLRSGKTLVDLYQQYDIEGRISAELGVAVFNYKTISPLYESIVQESRGLILELDTWEVVSKSIDAFFEPETVLGQQTLAQFDWTTAKALVKYDGALICLYRYKGGWHVGTRFVADGSWPVYSINASENTITWRDLFEQALQEMGYDWEDFTASLDPDIFYTFEICAPENRVIVIYPDRQLHLVAAVRRDTLEEIAVFHMEPFSSLCSRMLPQFYPVASLEDCQRLIEEYSDPLDHEGFVVVDGNFKRLKIRNPRHTQLMRSQDIANEISALRELRNIMMFEITPATGTVTSVPTSGSNNDGSLSATGPEGPELMQFGEAVTARSILQSIINRILFMSRYVAESYQQIKTADESERMSHPVMEIWPEAIEMFEKGMSMSEILDRTTEEEQLEALHRYEEFVASK